MSKYLIIGHGAREFAVAERLRDEGNQVIGALRKENDGLSRLCDQSVLVGSYGLAEIQDLCARFRPDILLPTDESAIFEGVGDIHLDKVKVLAPCLSWIFFERDKEAFKRFVRKINPSLTPRTHFCASFSEFNDVLPELRCGFVLKAKPPSKDIVLFKSGMSGHEDDVKELFNKHKEDGLTVEEYIEGEEFSVHVLFGEGGVAFSKSIQDYPFLLDGNKGEKTGGMGAISGEKSNLPTISQHDYDTACEVIRQVLQQAFAQFGPSKGFFSFQFFKTGEKVLLNEVDVHPGDPELIALLTSLRTCFSDVISNTLSGGTPNWTFDSNHVVTQCFVPRGYPSVVDSISRRFFVDPSLVTGSEARVYWGNSRRLNESEFLTGTSRSLAIAAAGDSFSSCRRKLSELSQHLSRNLHARTDIGLL